MARTLNSAASELLDKMLAEKAAEDAAAFAQPCSAERAQSIVAFLKSTYRSAA